MARATRLQRQILVCAALCGVLVFAGRVADAPEAATAASRNGGALHQTVDDPARALTPWVSTQLHIHSWSNHNAGPQPGSMQYHSAWAQAKGLDVIWWTDHNKLFVQEMDLPLYLPGAAITNTLDIAVAHPPGIDPWFRAWQIGWLDASVAGAGTPAVALNNGVLRMELNHGGSQFSSFSYRALDYQQRRIGGQSFVRPLVSDPVLSLDASRCDAGGVDAYAEIRFGHSWHTANGVSAPQELVYRLTAAGQPPAVVASSRAVTFSLPLSTGHIERSLLADARLLPHGDDNAIQDLTFKIASRNNASACLEISNFLISSAQRDPAANFAAQRSIAQRLEAAYGIVQHVGWEQNAGEWHLNPYLARQAALTPGWQDSSAPVFSAAVHAQDGLVALNHPFGADYPPLLPPSQQDALVQNRLNRLLPARAWGVDLLEIYLDRAGVDLAHHLKLWDLLAANGVPLCGIATSDQHGGPLTSPRTHMVTWINAPNPSQDALLAGLAGCRAFFGRIDLFDGIIDLNLGPIVMGGVHPTAPRTGLLNVTVDPLPPGAEVRLVQVADQPGSQLTYIVDHAPIDPSQPVAIDISRPGFVRVELWSVDGVPIAFSNRITLNNAQCDVDQSAGVDIVDVQLVAGAFNQTVPPAPVAYDLLRDNLIDVRDVTLAAECWLARR